MEWELGRRNSTKWIEQKWITISIKDKRLWSERIKGQKVVSLFVALGGQLIDLFNHFPGFNQSINQSVSQPVSRSLREKRYTCHYMLPNPTPSAVQVVFVITFWLYYMGNVSLQKICRWLPIRKWIAQCQAWERTKPKTSETCYLPMSSFPSTIKLYDSCNVLTFTLIRNNEKE